MPFDDAIVFPIPARRVEDALRLGLAPLRLKTCPVEWQRNLVEKLQEAFIAQLGQLFFFSRQFAICQGNGALPPGAPKEEAVLLLFHQDLLVGERRSVCARVTVALAVRCRRMARSRLSVSGWIFHIGTCLWLQSCIQSEVWNEYSRSTRAA